jgi:D-alanyl-D-alanine carboxypeptidase
LSKPDSFLQLKHYTLIKPTLLKELASLHEALGLGKDYIQHCTLPLYAQSDQLVDAGKDISDRPLLLTDECLQHWQAMQASALKSGVVLLAVSGFRSYAYQASLLERKLRRGLSLKAILTVNVPPGYSEHHTGYALDITTTDCSVLSEEFAETKAFLWLKENAAKYNFTMSYPKDNGHGLIYEPWHWAYKLR